MRGFLGRSWGTGCRCGRVGSTAPHLALLGCGGWRGLTFFALAAGGVGR